MHVNDLNKGYRETIATAVKGATNALVSEFKNRKKKPKDRDMAINRYLEINVKGYLLGIERAISVLTKNSNLSQWAQKEALKGIDLEKDLSYGSVYKKAKLKMELEK
tara:strand:+ start:52 stop:372 length:321 start_codon:yes stop_codon:yes gene_type:complete